jgi:hypothetical protein
VRSPNWSFRLPLCFVTLWLGGVALLEAAGSGWPDGYVIAENSKSPNGRYGVLIPTRDEAGSFDDEDKVPNTLADLKAHKRIAVIRDAHYYQGQNHRDLSVQWTEDSSWCAVVFEGRYGFAAITLIELKSGTQTDIGEHIQKELDANITAQAGFDSSGYGSAKFRAGPGQTVLVRATAYTNPKALPDQRNDSAVFLGTFDLAKHRWTRSESKAVGDFDPFEVAFSDYRGEKQSFTSDEDRRQWLDERLNDVYGALRVILSTERFATVKKEQLAWIKRYEAAESASKKCDLLTKRIEELRRYAW